MGSKKTQLFPARGEVNPTFDTQLSATEEARFQTWRSKHVNPNDLGQDYDFRGAWKAGMTPGADSHWKDTFKKPNHKTFSDESVYSSLTGTRPGSWKGETYTPFGRETDTPMEALSPVQQRTARRQSIWTPPTMSQITGTIGSLLNTVTDVGSSTKGLPKPEATPLGALPKPGYNRDENRQLDLVDQ